MENHVVSRFVSHIVDSLSSSTHFQMLDPVPGYISTRRSVEGLLDDEVRRSH
jgi:hypothetical protein